MTRDAEAYAALLEDLDLALDHVTSQTEDHLQMRERAENEYGPDDEMAWSAVGFTLHNLYNAIENYFLRVAKFFENQLEGSTWHRDLVNRMAHAIEGVRPAFLKRNQLEPFHELRSFRHTFRSLYDRHLDPRRVKLAGEYVEPAVAALRDAHDEFVRKVDQIRRGLL